METIILFYIKATKYLYTRLHKMHASRKRRKEGIWEKTTYMRKLGYF